MAAKTDNSGIETPVLQAGKTYVPDGKGQVLAKETTSDHSASESPSRTEILRKRSGGAKIRTVHSKPVSADEVPPGEGWIRREDFFWERSIEYPLLLPESFTDSFVLPKNTTSGKLVFYDLETTGLSGGAGNTAFLIGLGFHKDSGFTVRQLFLADYPGEEALLRRYEELAGRDRFQVSYNGKSFDSQVLRTRFLLNRIVPESLPQVDLLYPSRRLWRGRLENLSLRNIETDVLDFHRVDDLPGSEAPDAWFEWLDGQPERIEDVFQHNAEDVVSLAKLLERLEAWGKSMSDIIPFSEQSVPAEISSEVPPGAVPTAWGMARQWAQRHDARELSYLYAGWKAGERRCAYELAVRYRRAGRLNEAREVWTSLNTPEKDFHASVELAKDWEHRRKDPKKALELLTGLEALELDEKRRISLAHRKTRLERKAEAGRIES